MSSQESRYEDHSFENYPLTRQEYIGAMVHLYRGELTRANTWRIRLDNTTNWAIISTMALLSFTFGNPIHSHGSVLIDIFLVFHFLIIEARRYRFFDVWRNRVRMIEENFYGPLLTRELHSPEGEWGNLVAGDLLHPRFKITYLQAIRARLVRNYALLFGILLLAWVTKLTLHPPDNPGAWYERMAIGPISWTIPFVLVFVLYAFLCGVVLFVPHVQAPELEYWSAENPMGHITDF